MRHFRGQGQSSDKRYWFTDIGYNYRMSNLQAAVALAQLENVSKHMQRRQAVADMYKHYLREYIRDGVFVEQQVGEEYKHVYWMYSILLNNGADRDTLMDKMNGDNIETRPLFYPLHTMPPYYESKSYAVAEYISVRGLNLPSHGNLIEADIKRVCNSLVKHATV
jgi:perosamine synthetase